VHKKEFGKNKGTEPFETEELKDLGGRAQSSMKGTRKLLRR
jgi:hypothetical protein